MRGQKNKPSRKEGLKMDSLFSQILAGVISGVVTEFVVKLAIKAVKRKSSKKIGGANN